jgi:phosphoribosylaminoimidazole-succinocarboxamide synthase
MATVLETSLPNLTHRGKVRDTYELGNRLLLMVATDRLSAFDFILPTAVPEKGIILANLSAFWFRKTAHIIPNHFVAMANDKDALRELSDIALIKALTPQLARRAMVVKKAVRIDIECVVRGYITGSAWAEYRDCGTIAGQLAPIGIKDGDPLPSPIFTPTTKALEGHDEPMSLQDVRTMVGPAMERNLKEKSIALYEFARDYARDRGIILADSKMEFGTIDGELILIDELFTPDSSRFWDATTYDAATSLPSFDKQFVRDWLITSGWDRRPPAPKLPRDIVVKTQKRYFEAFSRITGSSLTY